MRSAYFSVLCSIPGVLLAAAIVGCGQGEYDARAGGAKAAITRRANEGPQELAKDYATVRSAAGSSGLKVRFPSLLTAQTTSLDASKPGAKLLQADLPGFCYTMQRPLADDAGKTIPAYCYLYFVPKAEADNLHNLVQAAAAMAGGGAWGDNPPVKAPTGDIAVKFLKCAGDMEFEVNGANERLPGQIEVYSFDAGANRVIVAWRAATSVDTKHKLFAAVKSSMASVQLDGPAPAAPAAPAPAAGS
ncbi:hypothetical protein [Anatilimnocola floriformis]|uniref:hypothetical protein n=1 Tax=Anatilimnocola floriformis TaxID=2948575 RepID=UPI0020C55F9E|nr:hypothetical protein [Anatilimnocola floriformis]